MRKLGFSLKQLPLPDPIDSGSIDETMVIRMADMFMEYGFTYFEIGYSNHQDVSEFAFRKAVAKRYPRCSYTITDQLPLPMVKNKKDLSDFFEGQLERLGTDYVDYYWLHGLNTSTWRQAEKMNAFSFLQEKKIEGNIRHIGLSFLDRAEILDKILTKHPEIEYVQLRFDAQGWNDPAALSRLCYKAAETHRKPVIAALPENDASSVVLAASLPCVMMVLPEICNEKQMVDNIFWIKEVTQDARQ